MNPTNIEWVKSPDGSKGMSWNPITGCLNNCDYCYARKLANTRLRDRYLLNPKVADIDGQLHDSQSPLWNRVVTDPFYPRFWEDRLPDPLRTKGSKQKGIFTCDMSDLFGIGIPERWTRRVLGTISLCPQHRFYLLTKQPQNLQKFSPFPDNCWVGGTDVGKYNGASSLAWSLQQIKATVKYVSFEPLLNRPDRRQLLDLLDQVQWVIIGAQTKPTVLPKIEWVKEIMVAAHKAGIPVFLKDNLKPLVSKTGSYQELTSYGTNHLRQGLPDA